MKKLLKKTLNTKYNPISHYELCKTEKGGTTGHLLLAFINEDEAASAASKLDGLKFDKSHRLVVHTFAELEQAASYPAEYTPPTEEELEEAIPTGMQENLKEWTTDALGREQIVMKAENSVTLAWAEQDRAPEPIFEREGWTDTYTMWSPKGSYLATFHTDEDDVAVGVALWGGADMKKIQKFPHRGVKLIQFSPQERYLVTWSSLPPNPQDLDNTQALMVWDILTGKSIYSSKVPKSDASNHFTWPLYQWAGDDSSFARMTSDRSGIRIISVPDMTKSKVDLPGVAAFAMSPTAPLLAGWVPEHGDTPARIALMNTKGKLIRHKNLFKVVSVDIHWQQKGEYLCVQVERVSKSGKTFFVNLEFFRVQDKEVPIETVRLDTRVIRFAWEPTGSRFAIIHGAALDVPRPDVSLYVLTKKKVDHIKTIEGKPANEIFWSPTGRHLVIAGLRELNGKLEFWSAQPAECLAITEHLKATTVEWDPTGRFVATYISTWSYGNENGYKLWSFSGNELRSELVDNFYQLSWRPRPDSLLNKGAWKKLKKTLHKKSIEYDRIDTVRKSSLDSRKRERRNKLAADYAAILDRIAADTAAMEETRMALLYSAGGPSYTPESDFEEVEVEVEELLKEVVEVVS